MAAVTEKAVKKKPVRGYVDGCFDIMHSGHYNAIRQAKALCDVLVVGVHSDAEILRSKGPPVMNNEERLATVKACKWADEVVFDTPYDPSLELLDKLNCDFSVHGDDTSTTADGEDAYANVRNAGRLRVVKRTEGISTTNLVGRLLLMTKEHHNTSNLPPTSPKLPHLTASNIPSGLDLDAGSSIVAPVSASPASPVRSRSSSIKTQHYSKGTNFLPTTYRISQFANGRKPQAGQKVIYIDGAFDLFHVGHISTLEQAKAKGDFLYVGIHDDETINKHKGKNYPIMNLHERVLNVLSCKFVDEVVIGSPWEVTSDLMTTLGIDLVVAGSNTKLDVSDNDAKHADPYAAIKAAGKFEEVQTTRHLTTSDVVKRIIDNRLKYEKRNASRSKKENDYLAKKEFVAEI